jgi:hypothetical protein
VDNTSVALTGRSRFARIRASNDKVNGVLEMYLDKVKESDCLSGSNINDVSPKCKLCSLPTGFASPHHVSLTYFGFEQIDPNCNRGFDRRL